MFSKSNLLATLAAFFTMFLLGYGIWEFLLAEFFEAHTVKSVMNEQMNMGLIAGSNLIAAFVLSTIYGKWARGYHSVGDGFTYGAWIGVFTGFGLGLLNYAVMGLSDLTAALVNGVVEVIFYGIIGVVIALVYKNTASKA
ncbi:hypothetical protein HME9304_01056 [Flagellimonas maritima]|uniref:DUF1761 domain-containing protein n=1 Tax=Flagellimonas maritima TaxID=1383885 RepID=A0A2Z4LQG7_9FLAO|nr:hypothetical protein [Allomuricauda aurantiaca]AWX44056.1 hypothetical protein HME9304_01056 [Allomuricauda aurantiaca]